MEIYKLNYIDKETAIADLLDKGVYVETEFDGVLSLLFGEGIQSVVEIGKIVKVEATYDADGKIITEPIYYDGYAYDVMCIQVIDFGANEIFPIDCKHSFLGYKTNADGPITNK